MRKKMQDLKKAQTIDDLQAILNTEPVFDISYRGGNLGFTRQNVINGLGLFDNILTYLPLNFGAYCNYLGGGLRGAITLSDFDEKLYEIHLGGEELSVGDVLYELAKACKRAYETIEEENGLVEEEEPDGETNWENVGTNASRRNGIISAY